MVSPKDESLVALLVDLWEVKGASDCEAKLVLFELGFLDARPVIEKVVRVEVIVAQELEEIAVE